ncbi:hypothetical protein GCM10028819_44490 [Spirosoma humi]
MALPLEQFLRADDLDETALLAQQLSELTSTDRAAITSLLEQWEDPQAIANLLMHPQLIPSTLRRDILLKGLHQLLDSYNVLAALVGLQRVQAELSEDDRQRVVTRIEKIIQHSPDPLAIQASVALFRLSRPQDNMTLVGLLANPDPTIRHNILATLVNQCRLDSQLVLDQAFAKGSLSPSLKVYADEQIQKAAAFLWAAKSNPDEWYLSDLSAPWLVAIPSLSEYIRDSEL